MSAKTIAMWIASLALGLPSAGRAAATTDQPEYKPAERCPLLFGGQAEVDRNKKARLMHLEVVAPGEHLINLTHTGSWQKPRIIRLQGVELVATAGLDGDRPSALVEVGQLPDGLNCEPGLYELGVDNSIGGQAHVLAIVDRAVLLDYKGDLRFIQTRQAPTPVFRMIWRSTWTITGASSSSSGPTPGPPGMANRHSSTRPQPANSGATHRATRKSATRR